MCDDTLVAYLPDRSLGAIDCDLPDAGYVPVHFDYLVSRIGIDPSVRILRLPYCKRCFESIAWCNRDVMSKEILVEAVVSHRSRDRDPAPYELPTAIRPFQDSFDDLKLCLFCDDRAGSARLNTQRPEISGLAAV
jgi:hypothetical protein